MFPHAGPEGVGDDLDEVGFDFAADGDGDGDDFAVFDQGRAAGSMVEAGDVHPEGREALHGQDGDGRAFDAGVAAVHHVVGLGREGFEGFEDGDVDVLVFHQQADGHPGAVDFADVGPLSFYDMARGEQQAIHEAARAVINADHPGGGLRPLVADADDGVDGRIERGRYAGELVVGNAGERGGDDGRRFAVRDGFRESSFGRDNRSEAGGVRIEKETVVGGVRGDGQDGEQDGELFHRTSLFGPLRTQKCVTD